LDWYFVPNLVIVRISSSAVPDANIGAYLEYEERNELPLYESNPGHCGVATPVALVAYIEVVALSVGILRSP
jgi:hypothetical protein